jgi:two-component system sensor histidine kinase HydH
MALLISVAITPYIIMNVNTPSSIAKEIAEVVFYFGIALLGGGIVDRENRARTRVEKLRLDLEHSYHLALAGQIAAGVAHEIKNPLASVRGAVEILTDPNIDDEQKQEFREIVMREVRRIDATVTDFLQLARPPDPLLLPMDLREVIEATLRQLEPQAMTKSVTLRSDLSDAGPMSGDRERIHEVLLNLLLNAMEASREGETITVALRVREGAGETVVSVADQGVGMGAETLERVFEPFYSTRSNGTGLGLSLVKVIVEQHAGQIDIQSVEHKGTTVTLRFPIHAND